MGNTFQFSIYNECCGQHVHDYPQILVPLRETLRIWIGNLEYEVTSKELCFIPPDMMHRCHFHSSLLVINISRDVLEKKDSGLLTYPLIIPCRDQITRLVEMIQEELQENPDSKSVRYLYDYFYNKLLESCSTASMRYISDHYDEPITVTQLAEMENYNVTYYNDWFKSQTGFPPSLYLRYVRISKAKELLTQTNFNIMEVAAMVGYSSNATFTRAFHSITGMTPKAYRECACRRRTG